MLNVLLAVIGFLCLALRAAAGAAYAEEVKIGAILPLTGNEASVGSSMQNGLNLACRGINSRVNAKDGRLFRIIFEDSRSDPKTAVAAYQRLTGIEGVKVIFTSVTGITLAVAPLAERDKVVVLSIGTAAPSISAAGDFVFRHNLLPQDEALALARQVYDTGARKIPMLVVNTDSGLSYRDELTKDFEALGGSVSAIEMYEKGASDFRTPLTRLKALKPQAIFILGYAAEMGVALKQARALGINAHWYSGYTAEDPKMIETGGKAVEGVVYTHYYDSMSEDRLFREFARTYHDRYGDDPAPYSALAYDFLEVLALVMHRCADPADSSCLKNELYKIKAYQGATGAIRFDENGDTKKQIILKTIRNGRFGRL